jgi:hypothetical protein
VVARKKAEATERRQKAEQGQSARRPSQLLLRFRNAMGVSKSSSLWQKQNAIEAANEPLLSKQNYENENESQSESESYYSSDEGRDWDYQNRSKLESYMSSDDDDDYDDDYRDKMAGKDGGLRKRPVELVTHDIYDDYPSGSESDDWSYREPTEMDMERNVLHDA